MDIRPNYNPESNIFTLEFSSDLLKDYFNNLRGMLLDNKDVINSLVITRKSKTTAKIEFKVSREEISKLGKRTSRSAIDSLLKDENLPEELKSSMKNLLNNSDIEASIISIDANDMNSSFGKVNSVINNFISLALKDRVITTEFLPITNYPDDGLAEDVVNALKSKRNLCIVDDFENYKQQMQLNTYEFNQYEVKYGTSEYADVVLMLVNKEFKEFRKYYTDKLVNTTWI